MSRNRNYTEESSISTIEGRNSVLEALKAEHPINKLLIQKGESTGSIKQITAIAREKRIVIQEADKQYLDSLSETRAHQGVIALVSPVDYSSVDDILNNAERRNEKPFIIICDELNDPNNLGSIIRTADAVGAHGVIIPKRRSVSVNATVSKVSAGALEYIPVARVANIAQTIDLLKASGVWIAGADMDGDKAFYENDLKGAIALVVGSEGYGISRLVKEKCDFIVRIPMAGKISSLNAGVAAGILMYEIFRQRH